MSAHEIDGVTERWPDISFEDLIGTTRFDVHERAHLIVDSGEDLEALVLRTLIRPLHGVVVITVLLVESSVMLFGADAHSASTSLISSAPDDVRNSF